VTAIRGVWWPPNWRVARYRLEYGFLDYSPRRPTWGLQTIKGGKITKEEPWLLPPDDVTKDALHAWLEPMIGSYDASALVGEMFRAHRRLFADSPDPCEGKDVYPRT